MDGPRDRATREGGGVKAGYLFHGKEMQPADAFLAALRARLIPANTEVPAVERFYLDETGWSEIVDAARTAPMLFSPWRILVVGVPEPTEAEKKAGRAAGSDEAAPAKGKGGRTRNRLLDPGDEALLRAYFEAPAEKTVLVVLMPGDRRKHPLVKLFASLPSGTAEVRECRPLYPDKLIAWIYNCAAAAGKRLGAGAAERLAEVTGSDLRRLENEIAKLTVYTDKRPSIEARDVEEVSAWTRSYEAYDLDDALRDLDTARALGILKKQFEEMERPEAVLNRLAGFFRCILTAKTRLREGEGEREIFRTFFPAIQESWRSLYTSKFNAFFALVKGLSWEDLRRLLGALERIDSQIKTGDASAIRTWFEAFVFEFEKVAGGGGKVRQPRPGRT